MWNGVKVYSKTLSKTAPSNMNLKDLPANDLKRPCACNLKKVCKYLSSSIYPYLPTYLPLFAHVVAFNDIP